MATPKADKNFLRLGVVCAVIDDSGRILLSKRNDLNVWTLPGGRLDAGEALEEAAARESREETGVIPHIERAVGLYYLAGWQRMNVLYAGWPLGGEVKARTSETRTNQYFPRTELPEMPLSILVLDALAETRHKPRVIETSPGELRRLKLKLGLRWVKNWLSRRPEPKFPRFAVNAAAVVWEDTYHRVLTLRGEQARMLPRTVCNGEQAPWEALEDMIQKKCGVRPGLRWVGLWQDTLHDRLEFVFGGTAEEVPLRDGAEWSSGRNTALGSLDAQYVERVKANYAFDPVWTIMKETQVESVDLQARAGNSGEKS